MACFRAEAMRLEKRKELKEYTWHETKFSAMASPAEHEPETRVAAGSGYKVRPRKSPNVNNELT